MSDFHRVTSYLGEITYDVGDDTREQLALLVFVGAFLMLSQYLYSYDMPRGKPLHTIMNFKMTVNNWSLR